MSKPGPALAAPQLYASGAEEMQRPISAQSLGMSHYFLAIHPNQPSKMNIEP